MDNRVLFLGPLPTPFVVELALAVSELEAFEYHVLFLSKDLLTRGQHWSQLPPSKTVHVYEPGPQSVEDWVTGIFEQYKPHVVLSGFSHGPMFEIGAGLAQSQGSKFGVWAEYPTYAPFPKSLLRLPRQWYYRLVWRRAMIDFVLAIGDRAVDLYRRLAPDPFKVSLMPYVQDLTPAFQIPDRVIEPPIHFLFSGRLLARNRIRQMTAAFERLAEKRPGQFYWLVSADGPEEKWIRRAMNRSQVLSEAVIFDRDFQTWNDRLRPFASSHVLVLPAVHSGWGLVIPEALAAGMPVITTRGVEAGRYYVEHLVNGIFIEPTTHDIYRALEYCVDHPDVVAGMKKFTRQAALKGHVDIGAKRFVALLSRWF